MEINLAKTELCTGCSVCSDSCNTKAIEMLPNEEGFLYPHINSHKCVECGACMRSCPIINTSIEKDIFQKKIYYGLNNDISLTKICSSGAIAPALMQKVINSGGYIIGAAFDAEFKLEHSVCSDLKELKKYLGSKYLQSNTENIYRETKELLKSDKQVLFFGTPCQIDALNHLLKNTDSPNLITCEILCHGVPSPGLFKSYVNDLQNKYKSKIISYNFRDKHYKGDGRSVKVTFESQKQIIKKLRYNNFHTWFGAHLSIRKSCFNCQYRSLDRCADITLGDFWRYKVFDEKFNAENGVSVVIANSMKGQLLVNNCSESLNLNELEFSAYEKDINANKSTITNNFAIPKTREQFWKDYNNMDFIHFKKQWDVPSKYTVIQSYLKKKIKI